MYVSRTIILITGVFIYTLSILVVTKDAYCLAKKKHRFNSMQYHRSYTY